MITTIPFTELEAMTSLMRIHGHQMEESYNRLLGQLRTELDQWGDDTASKQAYHEFRERASHNFMRMRQILGHIETSLAAARAQAVATEAANKARFA